MFMPRNASTGIFQSTLPFSGSTPASSSRVCTRIWNVPPIVAGYGDENALPIIPPPSSSVRQTIVPVAFSSFTKPDPACTNTWSPMTSGLDTKPKAGSGLSSSFMKSARHRSAPVAASRHTSTSRIPATNTRPSSTHGVERIQEPLEAAKKGTLIEPSHSTCHRSAPVARSKARTCSVFASLVSVTITRSPATTGPE